MNKSVSHYLRDYLQLTGSAKFNYLIGGAERPLTQSELDNLNEVLNKYMVDLPGVAANDVFTKVIMSKDQFEAKKAAASTAATYATFADYSAFTEDWKSVQKALVTALLAQADLEIAAQEAAAAGPGEAPGSGQGIPPPPGTPPPGSRQGSPAVVGAQPVSSAALGAKPGSPASQPGSPASQPGSKQGSKQVSPASQPGSPPPGPLPVGNPFTFRLRGGTTPPSLVAAAIAASGVVVADGPPELKHFFTYLSATDKKIPDEFFTDLVANTQALKGLLKKDTLKIPDTLEAFTRVGILSNKLATAMNTTYIGDANMKTTIGIIINKLSTLKNSFPDAIKNPSAP